MAAKYTFAQFKAQYPDDDACLWAIFLKRHQPDVCPQCGVVGKLTKIAGRRAYACKEGCHTYPCAGTIFEHSPTHLTLWFHAMYLMTATRNGVSGKELERQLGVTYKCAYRIGQQLRKLMGAQDKASNPTPLSGHVEVDETFVGGKKHRSGYKRAGDKKDKAIVMGMAQRGGQLIGKVVESTGAMTLIPTVMENVAVGTKVSTDEWMPYKSLGGLGYKHVRVNHSMWEYARDDVHTNTLEGFWSHLKRGIRSTHCAVSKKHLQKYVDEFAWRFNNRHDPAAMFDKLISSV